MAGNKRVPLKGKGGALGKAVSGSASGQMNAKGRMTAVMLVCLAFAAAVMGRAAWVQVLSNPKLEQMAKRQFNSRMLVRPNRGSIVDRNGEPLAINIETHSLAANPSKVRDPHHVLKILSHALDGSLARIKPRLTGKKEFAWLKRHLDPRELEKLNRTGLLDGDNGVFVVKESQRVYPHAGLAAHVLGSVNIDSEGTEGMELWQEDRLRGKVVSIKAVKDALGRPTFIDASAAREAQNVQDGENVALTLDASLQFAVEQELRSAVARAGAKGGGVIVMNADSGEILALANEPSFNPNEKGAAPERRRNRVLTDGYEPGSTIKAMLLASALTHGMKASDQIWANRGELTIQGRTISEAESHEKFEWLKLSEIVEYSSNVGAAKLALKVGAEPFAQTLKSFGIGARTGTGFPGEIGGRVPLARDSQPLTVANIGFGQGLMTTPIQMTRAYAAFLNGGMLVQPSIIARREGDEAPEPVRVIPAKVASDVVKALESVVQDKRSGAKAALAGYRVAGKTGTAQKVLPGKRGYARGKYITSFIGFALDVSPRIVIFTSIDEPSAGSYYAAETAVPLFREVLNAVAGRFSLPTREGTAPRQLASLPRSTPRALSARNDAETERSIRVSAAVPEPESPGPIKAVGKDLRGNYQWKMPELRGLTPREAMQALQDHHFQVELHGSGVIRTQVPESGQTVADGSTVRLQLGEL